jgi:hypothetical protein
MRKVLTVTSVLAVMLAAGRDLQGQRGETPKPPTATAATTTAGAAQGTTVHLEGCVFPKRALTEKQPVTVPEGKVEDYVLSETTVVAVAEGTTVAPGTVLALQQADAALLRQLTGHWVGVTGRTESKPDMAVLQVVSIRETTGGFCPTVPTPKG